MIMLMKADLSAETVRALFFYDSSTGLLHWKTGIRAGKVAGTPTASGHLTVRVDGKLYYAHRIIWLIVTGQWPSGRLDHKNTVPSDNRFDNLRPCTQVGNVANSKLSKANTSGFKGVSWCKSKNKWEAYIGCGGGKIQHLGRYNTAEQAHAAYCVAAKRKFGEFFNDGKSS